MMTLKEIKHRYQQVEALECRLQVMLDKVSYHADWWDVKLQDAMQEAGEPEPMPTEPFDHD